MVGFFLVSLSIMLKGLANALLFFLLFFFFLRWHTFAFAICIMTPAFIFYSKSKSGGCT